MEYVFLVIAVYIGYKTGCAVCTHSIADKCERSGGFNIGSKVFMVNEHIDKRA